MTANPLEHVWSDAARDIHTTIDNVEMVYFCAVVLSCTRHQIVDAFVQRCGWRLALGKFYGIAMKLAVCWVRIISNMWRLKAHSHPELNILLQHRTHTGSHTHTDTQQTRKQAWMLEEGSERTQRYVHPRLVGWNGWQRDGRYVPDTVDEPPMDECSAPTTVLSLPLYTL